MRYIRRLSRQIYNFFKWGWRMRNRYPWDYAYLLETMSDFIGDIEKYIKNHGHSLNPDLKNLCIAKNLCKRIIEDDYTVPWNYSSEIVTEDTGDGYVRLKIIRSGYAVKKVMDRQYQMKRQDLELLGKILTKHITKWWD